MKIFSTLILAVLTLVGLVGDVRAQVEGQVYANSDAPERLVRDGGPIFLAGIGDLTDFFYRGTLNPDGTRDGDQLELIVALADQGANLITVAVVYGAAGEVPFAPWDPDDQRRRLNDDVLDQWDRWFAEMHRRGIVALVTLYGGGVDPGRELGWPMDAAGSLHPDERRFIRRVVDHLERHPNVIWGVGEKGNTAGARWPQRAERMAREIRGEDGDRHLIAAYLYEGMPFDPDSEAPIDLYVLSSRDVEPETPSALHAYILETQAAIPGRALLWVGGPLQEQLVREGDRQGVRQRMWAAAMAGAHVVLNGLDNDEWAAGPMQDLRRLRAFLESTEYHTMAPHDDLAGPGTQYVLALPGQRYVAYSSGGATRVGLRKLEAGTYDLTWFDCETGASVVQNGVEVAAGSQSWFRPEGIGPELALYVRLSEAGVQPEVTTVDEIPETRRSRARGNEAPVAYSRSTFTLSGEPVAITLRFTDPDGGPGPYSIVITEPPSHGHIEGSGASLHYIPDPDFSGVDRFSWLVHDGAEASQTVTQRIEVLPHVSPQ